MSDEILSNTAPEAVQADTLAEQPEAPRAQEIKPQAEEPKPEPKVKNSTEARADAVKKAIEKATKEPDPKADPAAEAKSDAKPDDKQADAKSDRAPDGKFAAKVAEEDQAEPAKPKQTAYKDAPQRFDDAAKAEWETVPESVRGAVHRAIKENEQGIEKYRADAESYEPLRQFDEAAKAHGNTLVGAVQKMVEIEDAFRRNPVEGFMRIARELNFDVQAVARHIAGLDPNAVNQHAATMVQSDLHRENAALKQRLEAVEATQQRERILSSAQSLPRFEELKPAMLGLIQTGQVTAGSDEELLRAAYQEADRRFPTTAAHTGDNPALAQTQAPRTANPAGQKSVAGPARGEASSSKQKRSRSEAIKEAMRAHGAI